MADVDSAGVPNVAGDGRASGGSGRESGGGTGGGTGGVEVRRVRSLLGKRVFVDVPFRVHGGDPGWVPPLRLSVYDRISAKHPANEHQTTQLWVAYRRGQPVGRIGACVDDTFNRHQNVRWGWIGFFDCFDDPAVADALFEVAKSWLRRQGITRSLGPANFTTNDEIGLLVEGFEDPPTILTLQNPRYYERLWTDAGWEPYEDLWAWHFEKVHTALSERQRRVLARIKERAGLRIRGIDMEHFEEDVRLFFELYNAAWANNLAFAPMSEGEIVHLAKQLKPIINPNWAFGVWDRDDVMVGVCLAVPDVNRLMLKARSGRLFPFTWARILLGRRKLSHARVIALGTRPDQQNLALGTVLYQEIVDRLAADPYIRTSEASWTLASNARINDQLEAMGAHRSKVWRLYQIAL